MEIAPVALFIFNRPELTARVFERVRDARPRRLLVVADGPRASRGGESQLCEAARKIATSPDWPCEVRTNLATENMGCRQRVSSGLDWVFQECSEAIILEDDCLPCPSFFTFCTSMLERYSDDARIMHVSGDNFQDGMHRGKGSYYFSRYSFSWGWASWRRAWRYYDVTMGAWPKALEEGWLRHVLDDVQEIDYWTGIFNHLHKGEIDTWDYQWLFTCWCQNGLSIHPNHNLVTNIGSGPDATHTKEDARMIGLPTKELSEYIHPEAVIRDTDADQYFWKEHLHADILKARRSREWPQKLRKLLAVRTRLRGLAGTRA